MTVQYAGLTAGSLVNPRIPSTGVRLRATFVRSAGDIVAGALTPLYSSQDFLRMAQTNIGQALVANGVGFVTGQSVVGPDDKAFTLDFRVAQTWGPGPAASLAVALDGYSSFTNLTRLQLIGAGEGSSTAAENRQETAEKAPDVADPLKWLTDLYDKLQAVGKGFLVLLVLAAIALVWYYLPRKRS